MLFLFFLFSSISGFFASCILNCTFTKCAIIFGSAVGTCHLDFFSDLQQLSPPKQPTIVAHSNSIISTNILMLSMGEGSEEKSCLHVRPREKPLFFLSHCLFVALFCHMSPVFFRGEDKWFGHSLALCSSLPRRCGIRQYFWFLSFLLSLRIRFCGLCTAPHLWLESESKAVQSSASNRDFFTLSI